MAEKQNSKFWAGDNSDDSEEEESNYSSEASEEEEKKVEEKKVWGYESDSSEEDAQRTVKTAKQKTEDAFEKVHTQVKNSLNISDWNNVAVLFTKLPGMLTKHADVVKSGKSDSIEKFPEYYFLSLKIMKDSVDEISSNRAAQKKLSKTNSKSFNVVKARLKKLLTEEYESRMNSCQEKIQSMESEDDESESSGSDDNDSESEYDSESGSEVEKDSVSGNTAELKDGDDEVDWDASTDSEEESESEESSSEDEGPQLKGRARWLKKVPGTAQKENAGEKKVKEAEKFERAKQRKLQKEADVERRDNEKSSEEEFTEEIAKEKAKTLLLSRGKKGNEKQNLLELMQVIVNKSVVFGQKFQVQFRMHLIALMFDVKSGLDEHMPIDLWLRCFNEVRKVVSVVQEHDLILEGTAGDDELDKTAELNNKKVLRVLGDLSTFVDRLHSEYEKSLRQMENLSQEYVQRLQHESYIKDLANSVNEYYIRVNDPLKSSVLCMIMLQTDYYKHETVAKPVLQSHLLTKKFGPREFWHPASIGTEDADSTHPAAQMGSLPTYVDDEIELKSFNLEEEVETRSDFVQRHGTIEMKCVATLAKVFHFALHDKFTKAKDLLVMSQLQENIYSYNVESQILFNRTLAQLGFSAFRQGDIKNCHMFLMDLCQQGSKTKELLAQGVYWRKQMYGMDSKALEAFQRIEKRRMLPYHLHINVDFLEFFHLTSAMLLEVPLMALQQRSSHSGSREKIISRTFRRYLEQFEKRTFNGPPESTKDHILLAALALREGDWKKCADLLMDLPIWQLFSSRCEETKELLLQEIKRQALRTYLITFGSLYTALSGSHLEALFSIKIAELKLFTHKLIYRDEVKGMWEKIDGEWVLQLTSNEPSHLQALANRFAAQISKLAEANERRMGKAENSGGRNEKKSSSKHGNKNAAVRV